MDNSTVDMGGLKHADHVTLPTTDCEQCPLVAVLLSIKANILADRVSAPVPTKVESL